MGTRAPESIAIQAHTHGRWKMVLRLPGPIYDTITTECKSSHGARTLAEVRYPNVPVFVPSLGESDPTIEGRVK